MAREKPVRKVPRLNADHLEGVPDIGKELTPIPLVLPTPTGEKVLSQAEYNRLLVTTPDQEPVAKAVQRRATYYSKRRLREIAFEIARRRCEALKLYTPLPMQEEFHKNPCMIRVIRGGNRSGKSTAAFVEVARAITGQDPHGKYPVNGGVAIVVGYDQDHIGNVVYRMLFRSGAFQIIRDLETGYWRAYDPVKDKDRPRREVKPAPPLVPPRYIKKMTYEKAGEKVFSVVELASGWELRAYSSRSKPPQGFKADLYHIDEDIDNEEIVDEALARLPDLGGRFIWSALPHSRNLALLTLSKQAWSDELKPECDRDAAEVVLRFRDNPHIEEHQRDKLIRAWSHQGSQILRMRDEGEYTLDEFKVFPEFSMDIHGWDIEEPGHKKLFPDGQLPKHWCRYAVIDPGFQVCAVLFAALPPPKQNDGIEGDFVYLENELYIRNCSSDKFAEQMRHMTMGKSYRAFIIDAHGAAHTHANGLTIRRQYTLALEKYGVASEMTGHGFINGSDDKESRIMAVHGLLHIRDSDGFSRLRVMRKRTPMLLWEMERYMKMRTAKNEILDKPDDRKNCHAMHALQYLAAYKGLVYRQPEGVAPKGGVAEYMKRKRRKKRKKDGPSFVNLGVGL